MTALPKVNAQPLQDVLRAVANDGVPYGVIIDPPLPNIFPPRPTATLEMLYQGPHGAGLCACVWAVSSGYLSHPLV